MNSTLAHWRNPRFQYQDSATHASAESFRRRQEQRQREAEQHSNALCVGARLSIAELGAQR